MRVHGQLLQSALMRFAALAGLATLCIVPTTVIAPAAQADTNFGGGCILFPNDRMATVNALRTQCSIEQQDKIFFSSSRGDVPMGVTDGWVARPPVLETLAPAFWIGKTFYTGPNGGTLLNRITGANIPGFPAYVYSAPERVDHQPAWILDYAPSITPQILDEIREVSPGVWFGYSWWRGAFETALLLSFVLIEHRPA
ncbi:hypothetical protein KO481_02500 [Nocardia sp. NEAU-G5]|uniref:Uncharacterized protein n=1 Tax=Nocardia albiluteola TaxID=2842303 RepID=A0ABS6AQU6_9NOCA|nr:hypothetical protein [Nocardia albiluteola]MBU3060392.1 hypothetical protein [Nocardia albiluteola]